MKPPGSAWRLAAARAGLSISVMHRALGLADPLLGPVLPDLVVATLPVWVVTHRDLRHEARIRATLEHLVTCFTSNCEDQGGR